MAELSTASVSMSLAEYMRSTAQGGSKPRNEYEHGHDMVDSVIKDEKGPWSDSQKKNMIIKFSQVVDKYVQMANIRDDKLLRIYQNEVGDMCQGLDMSIREEFIAHIFAQEFFAWRGELLMTHAKEGEMLKIQAAIGKGQNQVVQGQGYGFAQEEEDLNIIQKLLGKRTK